MPTDDVRSMVRRESVLNHSEGGRGHHEHHCPVGHHGAEYGHDGLGLAEYLAKGPPRRLILTASRGRRNIQKSYTNRSGDIQ